MSRDVWPRIQPPEEVALVAAANVAIDTEDAHDWAIVEVFDRALTRRVELEAVAS